METIREAQRRIEQEFDEPLRDVVHGYVVEMGYSMPLLAEVLEVSVSSIKHFCSRQRIRGRHSPLEHREIRGRPPRIHRECGRELSLSEWASELNLSVEGVRKRISRRG